MFLLQGTYLPLLLLYYNPPKKESKIYYFFLKIPLIVSMTKLTIVDTIL